jgi:hypothetical protein
MTVTGKSTDEVRQETTSSPLSAAPTTGDVPTAVVVVGLAIAIRWLARALFRLLSRPL